MKTLLSYIVILVSVTRAALLKCMFQFSSTAKLTSPLQPCSSGSLDSNWVVGATLEKKLLPLPLSLALGAFLNHRKNKFQCGFGVTIG